MKVLVKLFATLREGRFDVKEMDLPEGTRVGDVLLLLQIPPREAAICLVNGRSVEGDAGLADGDTVVFFPPLGGG